MIPNVCANCAKGINVFEGNTILGTVCYAGPQKFFMDPNDLCLMFAIDPAVVEQDQPTEEDGDESES